MKLVFPTAFAMSRPVIVCGPSAILLCCRARLSNSRSPVERELGPLSKRAAMDSPEMR